MIGTCHRADAYFLRALAYANFKDKQDLEIGDYSKSADLYKLDGNTAKYDRSIQFKARAIKLKESAVAKQPSIQRDNTQKVALTSGTTEQRMQQQRMRIF